MSISLTKKVGYISLGKGFISLSSIAIGAILSRFLTKESYGTYRQLWLLYNTLYPIISLRIPTSVNYFISQSSPSHIIIAGNPTKIIWRRCLATLGKRRDL